ncbi:UNVERIFIED_CONTAM: hypothetical protein NCL1_15023 [Trichonephila clavipes]
MTINNDIKRIFDFPYNDKEDFLISKQKPKRSFGKLKFGLDSFTNDGGAEKDLLHYIINPRKGLMVMKNVLSYYYFELSKIRDRKEQWCNGDHLGPPCKVRFWAPHMGPLQCGGVRYTSAPQPFYRCGPVNA